MCDEGKGGEVVLRNGLEPWHLLIVAIVFIVMFGSKKLPDTARALGRSMRILKSEAQAMKADTQVGEGVEGAAERVVDTVRTEPVADRREPVADR